MFAALVAAAIIGFLVVAAAKPLWLGVLISSAIAYIPFPAPLELTVAAISLTTLQLHGIRIIIQQWTLLSIETIALNLWPLQISVFNVRGRLNFFEDVPKLRYKPALPGFAKPLLVLFITFCVSPLLFEKQPYVLAFAVKIMSLLQIEINRIEVQVLPCLAICGRQDLQSISIQQICFKNGRKFSLCSLYCQAFNSSVSLRTLQADISLPLTAGNCLSTSFSDVQLHLIQRVNVALSAITVNIRDNAIEAVIHVVTASTEKKTFCFLGEFHLDMPLQSPSVSISLFAFRFHLDPLVGIISALQPFISSMPVVTLPKREFKLCLYSTDIQVTAIQQTLVLACIEELEVFCSPDATVCFRNIHSKTNGHDILRVSSFSSKPSLPKLVLDAGDITINAHLELVKIILPLTKLAFEFASLVPKSPSAAAPLDVELRTGSIQVSMPRMFDVKIESAKVEVSSQQQFIMLMVKPECIYDSNRFLSFSFFKLSGQQATSTCPHPTIDISGDTARGHWSPPMQYDLLYLVKEIIAAVIRCKRDLYPLLFSACDQLPTPQPAQVARGLPSGESPFYDWAFRDRAPYLVDKLQVISMCVSDILLTAAIDSSLTVTVFVERFLSEFLPWHWHLSRLAICLDSFPLLHLLSLDISRDCDCQDITLSQLRCDPALTEQTAKLLMYSPIRMSAASIRVGVPSSDSSLYDTIHLLSILHQTRGLAEALCSIPSLDSLARQDDGPGYRYPPDFRLKPVVNFHCRHLTVSLIDTCWNSWIHQVRPVGLDERMGSDSRRELLRLKIREHQRRTGQLLSDAKISLMSSRLAESNFELYRNRIVRLKATHAEKWSFPPLDCISVDHRPGNLRLGSLLSVSISELVCQTQIATQLDDQEFNENLLISAMCSLHTEALEISIRQFCPSVVDISNFHCTTDISIQQDSFGPRRSCNLNLSPRHHVNFTQPLYPPLISIRAHSVHVIHPCVTLSRSLLSTLQDLAILCQKLRPSFIDPTIRSLAVVDIIRYVFEIQSLENVVISNFSLRILQQMAFCTSTDSPSHPSLLIKGSEFRIALNPSSKSFNLFIDEVAIGLSDERHDSKTKVHMSHESVHKPDPSEQHTSVELYETGTLLQCFKVDCSASICFIAASGVPCTARCITEQTVAGEDPFEAFRTSRVAVTMKLLVGSGKHQTKMTLNTQNLPFLLPLCRRMPAISMPDISALQFSCSLLSVLNCSFTLLDAASNDDPGQGLRFQLSEIKSKFDVDLCAIHNLYISVSGLNASLIANEAFWRKCETGHELAHEIRNGTVVVVHTYENQRFILGQGWLSWLLPTDRPSWSDIDGTQELRRDSPLFNLPSEHWHWKSDWVIDRGQLCGKGKVDPDGWEYAHDFPRTYTAKRHWTDNVRRRRWFRVRRLIDSIDKKIRTNIEEKRNRRQNGLLFLVDSCQIAQKSCSTLIFRSGSPLHSPSKKSVSESSQPDVSMQVTRVVSLLTFFSIGTQPSPTAVSHAGANIPSSSPKRHSPRENADDLLSDSPYLFSVKIVHPRARMTLESRNAIVQLFRSYMLYFEYYFRLRSGPAVDATNIPEDKPDELVFSPDEISDDDEADPNEGILVDFNQTEDENVELISQTPTIIADGPECDSINPVDLLDIVSIEISNGQIALESPVESACGIVLACMHSCLITARSFDNDGSKQETERVDIRLLIDNLTIRLAPTDIDVDAKPMWFDFKECLNQSVMKAIVDPFPIQASAMFYPFSSSSHNVFLLFPTINATLDHLQCALLESIISRVLLADLPLPPLQSATEFVRFSFAGVSAFDGRITNHQRILWQIRHLEWLMGVYCASDPIEDIERKSGSGELALLSAHVACLRQQFVDSIMSVSVDLHTHLSAMFSANPLDFHFRLEAFTLSLVFVNRIEFVRITIAACSGLVEVEFKGEGSLKICFEIRDVRVVDTRSDMEEWKNVLIPGYICCSNGLATNLPDQNAENRAVMTLQCIVKRVGGIVVICSCVLNVAHLVTRITQTLVDDLSKFITKQGTSKSEQRILQRGARLVPKVSGILTEVEHSEPPSPPPELAQEESGADESTPAHLRDLRLYCDRSQNSIIITYLRIGAVRATISFKGSGSSGMADFQGVSVRMPAMIYQKKTWTLAKFARRLRRDLIKSALKQAGPGLASFLKYKFGGTSTELGSFSYGSHEDLNALDIDLPVGSIPIQPSPHPIAKGKAAMGDIINKFKSISGDSADNHNNDQADEVKDPNKRYLLFGKPSNHQ